MQFHVKLPVFFVFFLIAKREKKKKSGSFHRHQRDVETEIIQRALGAQSNESGRSIISTVFSCLFRSSSTDLFYFIPPPPYSLHLFVFVCFYEHSCVVTVGEEETKSRRLEIGGAISKTEFKAGDAIFH